MNISCHDMLRLRREHASAARGGKAVVPGDELLLNLVRPAKPR